MGKMTLKDDPIISFSHLMAELNVLAGQILMPLTHNDNLRRKSSDTN